MKQRDNNSSKKTTCAMTITVTCYHALVLPFVMCCQNYPPTILLMLREHKKQLLLVQPQRLKRQPLECTHQNQMSKNLGKSTPLQNIKDNLIVLKLYSI